jgi:hypothetical protein
MDDKKLISLSAIVTAMTITFADLHDHGRFPKGDQIVGWVFAFLILSALGDAKFRPAAGISVVFMVGTLLWRGDSVIKYVTMTTSAQRKKREAEDEFTKREARKVGHALFVASGALNQASEMFSTRVPAWGSAATMAPMTGPNLVSGLGLP